MSKAAVIFAPGFEEGEGLAVVDVMRRAEISCDIVGLLGEEVMGAHDICVRADVVFDGSLDAYDMVVLPGGMGGALAMRDHEGLQTAVRKMDTEGKWVCAICAAPLALGRYGLLEGRSYTSFPTTAEKIENPGTWVDEIVHIDGNLLTSQGPGTAYAFAYALVDALGVDSEAIRNRMVYHNAFAVEGGVPSWETEAGRWETPAGPEAVQEPQRIEDPKVAVLMVEGYEESETMQIIDLLRRANVDARSYRFQEDPWVLSMQGMRVKSDERFSPEAVATCDVIVVPGGRTASAPLIANDEVMGVLRAFDKAGKLVCGMCSGTTVLEAAGVLAGKRATGYTGYGDKLASARFVADEVAVWDTNVVTSQGPATPYPFAFKVMEALGIDAEPMRKSTLYRKAGGR